jgi:hypothetical protein
MPVEVHDHPRLNAGQQFDVYELRSRLNEARVGMQRNLEAFFRRHSSGYCAREMNEPFEAFLGYAQQIRFILEELDRAEHPQ